MSIQNKAKETPKPPLKIGPIFATLEIRILNELHYFRSLYNIVLLKLVLKHIHPSEFPANLPGQFSLSGQLFLHWAATLKGLVEFQNKKKTLDHFSPSYLTQKCWFQDPRSSRWCAQD